jgi:hypothetical protein
VDYSFHASLRLNQHSSKHNAMVRLREIPRTAAFAWSPGSDVPLVVTGTRAGAVDADFSDETKLELWDLSLDKVEQGVELQPIASISTDSRYIITSCSPIMPKC